MLASKRKTTTWVWNTAQGQGEKPDELQGSGMGVVVERGGIEPERLKGGL